MIYAFEDCALDLARHELRRAGKLIEVEPQVFALLKFLIESKGRAVSKDDIVAAVWDGRAISDTAVTSRIKAVRRAIGDDGKSQRLVRTIHRVGYQFLGDVAVSGAAEETKEETAPSVDRTLRQVTVVALDPRSDLEEPEAHAQHRDRLMALLETTAEAQDATVLEAPGGAMFVVFGAERRHEDDNRRAAVAALDILGAAKDANLDLAAGIVTGQVVAGRDIGLSGPVFTAASFIAMGAEIGDVMATETVAAALPAGSVTEDMGGGHVVIRATPTAGEIFRPDPPMVGRRAELAQLGALWEDVLEQGGLVLISGPAGIGKSRLAREACRSFGVSTDKVVRFTEFTDGTASFEAQLFAALDGDDALTTAAGEGAEPVVRAALRRMAKERPDDVSLLAATSEERATEIAADAVFRLLAAATAEEGRAVIVEDAHWASLRDLNILADLAERVSSLACMLIVTERPDEARLAPRLTDEGAAATVELALKPLGLKDADRLVQSVAENADIDLARAGGNPLFLIQLGQAGASGETPETVLAHFQSRLDRADPRVREQAMLLSVLGEIVPMDFAADIISDLDPGSLAATGLVRKTGPSLAFAHALARDAVYETIPATKRKELHAAVVAKLTGDPVRRADHAIRGEIREAPRMAAQAALSLLMSRRLTDAEEMFHRARDLSGIEQKDMAFLHLCDGTLARERGDLDAALAAYGHAAEIEANPDAAIHGLVRMAWISFDLGRADNATDMLDRAVGIETRARAAGQPMGFSRAEIRWRRAIMSIDAGDYWAALRHSQEGLECGDAPHAKVRLLGAFAASQMATGQVRDASETYVRALKLARQNALGMTEMEALGPDVISAHYACEWKDGMERAALALDRAEAFDADSARLAVRMARAEIAIDTGQSAILCEDLAAIRDLRSVMRGEQLSRYDLLSALGHRLGLSDRPESLGQDRRSSVALSRVRAALASEEPAEAQRLLDAAASQDRAPVPDRLWAHRLARALGVSLSSPVPAHQMEAWLALPLPLQDRVTAPN